jgi:hypothetical protein
MPADGKNEQLKGGNIARQQPGPKNIFLPPANSRNRPFALLKGSCKKIQPSEDKAPPSDMVGPPNFPLPEFFQSFRGVGGISEAGFQYSNLLNKI